MQKIVEKFKVQSSLALKRDIRDYISIINKAFKILTRKIRETSQHAIQAILVRQNMVEFL
jgi:hypothetical protein